MAAQRPETKSTSSKLPNFFLPRNTISTPYVFLNKATQLLPATLFRMRGTWYRYCVCESRTHLMISTTPFCKGRLRSRGPQTQCTCSAFAEWWEFIDHGIKSFAIMEHTRKWNLISNKNDKATRFQLHQPLVYNSVFQKSTLNYSNKFRGWEELSVFALRMETW